MTRIPVSAVVITRNAGRTLGATLDSLREMPEVLVYDNGSTDDTVAVARRYANIRVESGVFEGFGPTKNRAAALAGHDWILSIDADETVSPGLMTSLGGLDLSDHLTAYAIHRRNFFMGREVRYSGWGDDWLVRLYNRTACGHDAALVHEKVVVPAGGKVVRLQGTLDHQAVAEIGDFLEKVNRYSELRRRQPLRSGSALEILLRSAWSFFRTFVLRLGFLDGWRGLVIAYSDANGVFFKHMKPFADEMLRKERGEG